MLKYIWQVDQLFNDVDNSILFMPQNNKVEIISGKLDDFEIRFYQDSVIIFFVSIEN